MVGGLGMAMSSTAMALQLMDEKGMTNNDSGQMGFSVLLFRDMAVILILAVILCWAGKRRAVTGIASVSRFWPLPDC